MSEPTSGSTPQPGPDSRTGENEDAGREPDEVRDRDAGGDQDSDNKDSDPVFSDPTAPIWANPTTPVPAMPPVPPAPPTPPGPTAAHEQPPAAPSWQSGPPAGAPPVSNPYAQQPQAQPGQQPPAYGAYAATGQQPSEPGQQYPAYGQQTYASGPPTEANTSGIVLTIVSALSMLFTCLVIGIPSLVLGILALTSNGADPVGSRKKAKIGWIVYAVNFGVVALIGIASIVFLLANSSGSSGVSSY